MRNETAEQFTERMEMKMTRKITSEAYFYSLELAAASSLKVKKEPAPKKVLALKAPRVYVNQKETRKREAIRQHAVRLKAAYDAGRELRPPPLKVLPKVCLVCERPIRSPKKPPDGITIQHSSGGLCVKCVRYKQKAS